MRNASTISEIIYEKADKLNAIVMTLLFILFMNHAYN